MGARFSQIWFRTTTKSSEFLKKLRQGIGAFRKFANFVTKYCQDTRPDEKLPLTKDLNLFFNFLFSAFS